MIVPWGVIVFLFITLIWVLATYCGFQPGDCTRDGLVNSADLNRIAGNWQQSGGWTAGDFTGDRFVDSADLNILAATWNPKGHRSVFVPQRYQNQTFGDEFDFDTRDLNEDGGGLWQLWYPYLGHPWEGGIGGINRRTFPGREHAWLGDLEGFGDLVVIDRGRCRLIARPIIEPVDYDSLGLDPAVHEYAVGQINSRLSFAQTYGYWEWRIRVSEMQPGLHGAAWLLQREHPPADGVQREIDNPEWTGLKSFIWQNVHGQGSAIRTRDIPDPAGWHVYGVEVTRSNIRLFIDGQCTYCVANLIYHQPLFVQFTWEIGTDWDAVGNPGPANVWPATFDVEYVRCYK